MFGGQQLALRPNLSEAAHADAQAFLARYVDPSGRVIRHDQGGDTVSEGQAYGMLIAVALDNQQRFDSIWNWTRTNLQQPDGLLASQWASGRVINSQPASDADLDAARALVLAADRFGNASYRRQGRALGHAVLARETVAVGRLPVLTAGPWARTPPAVINPSYFSPRAYADLQNVDHDPRWQALAETSRALTAGLLGGGRALAPDWARVIAVRPHSTLVKAPGANAAPAAQPIANPAAPQTVATAATMTSGLDAVRVAIRAAESCVARDRRIAAELWPLYRQAPGRASYAMTGAPRTPQLHVASLIAAVAAARAANKPFEANRLLAQAEQLNTTTPTYYGSAWLALGRILLTTNALGACQGA
jgi:endoglucanase